MKKFLLFLVVLAALAALYFWSALSWSYSSGERAGWMQKLSKKGWVCKTWEGELAMVAMPGAAPEKFFFTILDDNVAAELNKVMGKRVNLYYEEKVGLPGSCFGDTRYYVKGVKVADEIPYGTVVVPPPVATAPAPVSAPAPTASAAAPKPLPDFSPLPGAAPPALAASAPK
jgi:hypothetical protein